MKWERGAGGVTYPSSASNHTYMVCFVSVGTGMPHSTAAREMEKSRTPSSTQPNTWGWGGDGGMGWGWKCEVGGDGGGLKKEQAFYGRNGKREFQGFLFWGRYLVLFLTHKGNTIEKGHNAYNIFKTFPNKKIRYSLLSGPSLWFWILFQ